MTNPYQIIFDPRMWPTVAKQQTNNNPTDLSATIRQNQTPFLIPDRETIQNSTPTLSIATMTTSVSQSANTSHDATQERLSKQDIAELLDEKISNMRVYVLESDITQAQNSIKSVVDLATF